MANPLIFLSFLIVHRVACFIPFHPVLPNSRGLWTGSGQEVQLPNPVTGDPSDPKHLSMLCESMITDRSQTVSPSIQKRPVPLDLISLAALTNSAARAFDPTRMP